MINNIILYLIGFDFPVTLNVRDFSVYSPILTRSRTNNKNDENPLSGRTLDN